MRKSGRGGRLGSLVISGRLMRAFHVEESLARCLLTCPSSFGARVGKSKRSWRGGEGGETKTRPSPIGQLTEPPRNAISPRQQGTGRKESEESSRHVRGTANAKSQLHHCDFCLSSPLGWGVVNHDPRNRDHTLFGSCRISRPHEGCPKPPQPIGGSDSAAQLHLSAAQHQRTNGRDPTTMTAGPWHGRWPRPSSPTINAVAHSDTDSMEPPLLEAELGRGVRRATRGSEGNIISRFTRK